jgi:hypothetical protein
VILFLFFQIFNLKTNKNWEILEIFVFYISVNLKKIAIFFLQNSPNFQNHKTEETNTKVEMLFVFAPNLLLYEGDKQQIGCKNKWGW